MNAATVVTVGSFAVLVVLAGVALFAVAPDGGPAATTLPDVLPVLEGIEHTSTPEGGASRPGGVSGAGEEAPGGDVVEGEQTTSDAATGDATSSSGGDELATGTTAAAGAGASTSQAGAVHFANCAAARAAGAAPILAGEPGYRAGLDGDSDGVACETDAGPVPTSPSPTTAGAPTSAAQTTTTRGTTTERVTTTTRGTTTTEVPSSPTSIVITTRPEPDPVPTP
jgi:hypothetical protein